MSKIQNILTVVSNDKLCPRFYRLCLTRETSLVKREAKRDTRYEIRDTLIKSIKPGQFVHIRVGESLEPFFRRPFSVYRAQKYLEVFYEPIGPGTEILAAKKKGDKLDVLGPLGTPFTLPGKEIKQVVMIAGGIGIAPFLVLSDELKKRKNLELILLYGGRTKDHVYPMKEFKQNGVKVFVSTDDGSTGVKGRVLELFSKIKLDPKSTFLYTCGPHPMMAAVQAFAKKNNLKGQAACEEVMACALGACLGCSIKTTEGYKTVCYDGPAFDLEKVILH